MNCQEARNLWGAYHDGELDANLGAEIQKHCAGCPACRQFLTAQQQFEAALTRALKGGQATPDLWQREEAAIRSAFAEKADAARTASAAERPEREGWLTGLASLLWPSPKFYAGLAAVWVLLLVVNWQSDPGPATVSLAASPSPAQASVMAQRREFHALLLGTDQNESAWPLRYPTPKPSAPPPSTSPQPKAEIRWPLGVACPEQLLVLDEAMPHYELQFGSVSNSATILLS